MNKSHNSIYLELCISNDLLTLNPKLLDTPEYSKFKKPVYSPGEDPNIYKENDEDIMDDEEREASDVLTSTPKRSPRVRVPYEKLFEIALVSMEMTFPRYVDFMYSAKTNSSDDFVELKCVIAFNSPLNVVSKKMKDPFLRNSFEVIAISECNINNAATLLSDVLSEPDDLFTLTPNNWQRIVSNFGPPSTRISIKKHAFSNWYVTVRDISRTKKTEKIMEELMIIANSQIGGHPVY